MQNHPAIAFHGNGYSVKPAIRLCYIDVVNIVFKAVILFLKPLKLEETRWPLAPIETEILFMAGLAFTNLALPRAIKRLQWKAGTASKKQLIL